MKCIFQCLSTILTGLPRNTIFLHMFQTFLPIINLSLSNLSPIVELPLTYVGIPLTVRRPTAAQLQPLVDGMAGKLPASTSRLMSKTGRLVLVKSVLDAIPIYQMLVLASPEKTLKLMEKTEVISLGGPRSGQWGQLPRQLTTGMPTHLAWRPQCRKPRTRRSCPADAMALA